MNPFVNKTIPVQELQPGDWYLWDGAWRKCKEKPLPRTDQEGDPDVVVARASWREDVILWNTQVKIHREERS